MILRKGMWVSYKGKVGILIPEGRQLTIHLVDAKGATTELVARTMDEAVGKPRNLEPGDFTQAAFNDIPAPRRPSPEAARGLGYL